MVRLGYACISIPLRTKNIYTSRTLTLKSLREKGIAEAKKLAIKNIEDLEKMILYNEENGIRFFRITSNLFPHMENPLALERYHMEFAKEALEHVGRVARTLGHRLTMHPGQFAQLGSPREKVVAQTFKDLTAHAKIFEYLGYTPELGSVMIIHGGGSFNDKKAALGRWEANFRKLPQNVARFVALENDEFQYSVLDLLPLCENNGIPLCIDFFHHEVMKPGFDIFDPALIKRVMYTWRRRGIKPKCHWSNQAPGARKGTHGACVEDIPKKILDICKEYDCDIMIEAKDKDVCTLRMYEKHFKKTIDNGRITWVLQ